MRKTMLWKKNNKGSSMVLVIVTIALVSILVATLLSTTLANYQMKHQERVEKENFYSVEGALEEIKAGIQLEVSSAFELAYADVMENYTGISSREQYFREKYHDELIDRFKDPASSSFYNAEKLNGYLDKLKLKEDPATGEIIKEGAKIVQDFPGGVRDQYLVDAAEGIVLQNLVVKYMDKKGNVSQIKTDLLLAYPDLNLDGPSAMPALDEFSLVANVDMEISGTQSVDLGGNVYAGNRHLQVADGATMDITDVETMIATEIIVDNGTIADSSEATSTNIWTNDIKAKGGTATLSGNTYVANDLSISGNSAMVNLLGTYHGYGTKEAAEGARYYQFMVDKSLMPNDYIEKHKGAFSSAMIINGKNSTLDLSQLTSLSLADNAYISALSSFGLTQNTSMVNAVPDVDVQMGESVTVKSNQLAYLVPGELIGVGKTYGGVNPMTAKTYNALMAEYAAEGEREPDFLDRNVTIPGIGMSLNQLSILDESPVKVTGAQTVFYPIGGSSVVYLFFQFEDAESANNYFKHYYRGNKAELDDYLSIYNNAIQFGDAENITLDLSGNVLVGNATESFNYVQDTNLAGPSNVTVEQNLIDTYAALKHKMIYDYNKLVDEERKSTVYENLVVEDDVANLLVDEKFEVDDIEAIVSNMGTPYTIKADGTYEYNEAADYSLDTRTFNKGVLIVNGNVVVTGGGTFEGLIIASGRIIVKNGCTIKSGPGAFNRIIGVENTSGKHLYDFLDDGVNYLPSGTGSMGTVNVNEINIGELIITRNWEKQ